MLAAVVRVRLQKFLADAGIASRRHCEELIRAGRISVNGKVALVGQSIDPSVDRVTAEGKLVIAKPRRTVVAVYKPAGYLSSCRRGRETGPLVTELVPLGERLFPVGRLDRESEGLLLLTNDGELALRLTHPRYRVQKEYEVELDRPADDALLEALRRGVRLADGPARAVALRRVDSDRIRVVLSEGRKREIRRMLGVLGYGVRRLCRVRIGGVSLAGLRPGGWRRLDSGEIAALFKEE